MFIVGILIGIYAYSIFLLGVLGMLSKSLVVIFTVIFCLASMLWFLKPYRWNLSIKNLQVSAYIQKHPINSLLICLLLLQICINSIGALGPELAFDALWYHLTFPKLYLQDHSIHFISGGLLYYSTMPKLTEMLYVGALSLQGEILAKIIHFSFGLLSCVALYKIARKFFSQEIALMAVIIFYANLVVAWESITAYIDLARTFYETMALWAYLLWTEKNNRKYLLLTGVMVGLAISTKLLALGSLAIFSLLIVWHELRSKASFISGALSLFLFLLIAGVISSPWFIFSTLATGNPVYPFLSSAYESAFSFSLFSPLRVFADLRDIFLFASDPISPLYLIFIPFVFIFFKRFPKEIQVICFYALLALLMWYVTPRTGGGRFILPYLPAFSILSAAIIHEFSRQREYVLFYRLSVWLVLFVALLSSSYRAVANAKYIPFLLGKETKKEFLIEHLNFSYGDFYDTDGFFTQRMKPSDRVLLYGFHNLYYVNFPFIHESWVKKGDTFTYIAVQDGMLPQRFWYWDEIYYNPITKVRVYTVGGQEWVY